MKQANFIQLPRTVYDNLINHLKLQANTDLWAKNCLEQLQAEAKPIILGKTGTGTWILDSNSSQESYKLS